MPHLFHHDGEAHGIHLSALAAGKGLHDDMFGAVDDDLRAKAAAVYDELGIDLPTAIRMFLKRSVVVNGVPFSMTLPKQEYRAERAIRAVQSLSEAAQQNGTADMSLDEINAEIAASRADRASRNARNGA